MTPTPTADGSDETHHVARKPGDVHAICAEPGTYGRGQAKGEDAVEWMAGGMMAGAGTTAGQQVYLGCLVRFVRAPMKGQPGALHVRSTRVYICVHYTRIGCEVCILHVWTLR